jgi:homospermidine synthase
MISDVQGWLNDASGNYGWFVLGAESITGSAKRFATRENTDATLRPTLEVTYVIPAPGTALALSGMLLPLRRRRPKPV